MLHTSDLVVDVLDGVMKTSARTDRLLTFSMCGSAITTIYLNIDVRRNSAPSLCGVKFDL
jgi:hypothetical protein